MREAGADRDLVLNLMGKAGKAEKTADWAAGLEIYDQLTEIVERQRGQAATATATATTAAAADGKAATPADPGAAFNARLAALMPAIKAAIVAAGPSAQDIKLKVSEAGMLARKKEFVAAGTLLDQVDKMVKPAGATKPQAGGLDDVDFRKRWSRAADGWRQAVDTVNAQVEKLQSALRGIDDAELKDIAEFGLPGVTGNHRSRLMAAMMDIDAAQGEALSKAAGRAARLAQGFEGYLASSEAVEATDTNPFGVHVSIRASLGPALAAIQQALAPVA